jgi:hypothetical protein
MRERAINIGTPVPLAGVICEPQRADPDKPVVVILNSGVMHHVGACRLSVKLARELAQRTGLLCVRFDFSGIGDSGKRGQNSSLEQLALEEIREVLDYFETHRRARRFILCGLCSGAHNAMAAAVDDARVVGLVQFDGHCYPTWKSYLYFYAPRLLKRKHWKSVTRRAQMKLRGDSRNNPGGIPVVDARFVEQPLFAAKPPKETMQAGLLALVNRQVKMFFVYTGSDHLDFMYPQQYVECFHAVNFKQLLTVEHYPTATHIFTEPHYQHLLIEQTVVWSKTL